MTRLAHLRACLLLCLCLPWLSLAQSPANTAVLHVTGAVRTDMHLDRPALEALPRSQITVGAKVYAGVDLWTLLSQAGPVADTNRHNPLISMYVLATGADGYRAVFALAEIDPNLGGRNVLVAYQVDGTPLSPREGDLARLIVPDDKKPTRAVHQLTELRLVSAP